MGLIVQKFGGSSLASAEHVRGVAEQVLAARRDGHDVVVVVSAMGKMTSDLLGRAQALTAEPQPRELDMLLSAGERISMSLLAMALGELGIEAISLTGVQAGIHTDSTHFNARITDVSPQRVRDELDRGRVVVVAGYQGEGPTRDVTTLGIGGSDISAVALAGALGAERCEICSDVDGVYSADPRKVTDARRYEQLTYLDVLANDLGVMDAAAISLARENGLPIVVFNIHAPGAFAAVMQGEGRFTRIVEPK